MLSPDCTKFVISIPKNASSYLVDWSTRNGWSSATVGDTCDWHLVQEIIVFLRDPVQRWVSGISQYISGHVLNVSNAYTSADGPGPDDQFMSADEFIKNYNSVAERLLFDQLSELDDHVWPQIRFLDVLPSIPRIHFVIDTNFTDRVSQYLKFDPQAGLDYNRGDSNPDVAKLQQFFQLRLNSRPELIERVKLRYQQDYEYIKHNTTRTR
jgi:hypothetical protein